MLQLNVTTRSAHEINQTTLLDTVLDVLDGGLWDFDPKTAMTIAIATPVSLIALCLVVMVCRGVPTAPCGGKCTYWRRMPRGTEPDHGIGEHQDELAEVDSVDEQMEESRVDEDPDTGCVEGPEVDEERVGRAQRECCSKMAAALENGMNGHGDSYPASIPSSHKRGKSVAWGPEENE